jgi:hypothetical protein
MINRKLLAAGFVHVLTLLLAFFVTKNGLKLDTATAAEVSWFISVMAGFAAGWLAKEFPAEFGGPVKLVQLPEPPAELPVGPQPIADTAEAEQATEWVEAQRARKLAGQ